MNFDCTYTFNLAEPSKSELNESTSTVAMASEVWRKFKVDSNKVDRWSVNLRTVSLFNSNCYQLVVYLTNSLYFDSGFQKQLSLD